MTGFREQPREPNRRAIVGDFIDQGPNMKRSIDPLFSASRGTLVGDLLWLGAIGFIIAIITGMIG